MSKQPPQLSPQHSQKRLQEPPQSSGPTLAFEQAAYRQGYQAVAGVDEAGRGPLAGPVVAAACLLPQGREVPGVDDSKKLTPAKREHLYDQLTSDPTILWGVGIGSVEEIDTINILQATIQAMLRAVAALQKAPDYLLVDGLILPHPTIPGQKIIKGDTLSQSIAAASIIAKETRDRLMVECDTQYPQYAFAKHKGYGTAAHRAAIAEHGPCPLHRRTFEPVKSMVGAC